MNTSRLALVLLLLGSALGIFFAVRGSGEQQLPPRIDAGDQEEAAAAVDPMRQVGEAAPAEREPVREEHLVTSGEEYGQGVRGTVVDPRNFAVAGAKVYLVESSPANLFLHVQAINDGVEFQPTASDVTDAEGSFHLGLREPSEGATFEVRVITDEYADHKIPNLTIQPNDWYDTGPVRLEPGAMVYGRITAEGEAVGIPDAKVYITASGGTMELTPTPGREAGLEVEADESGYFEVRNAPGGTVDISAAAPNFARLYRRRVSLDLNVGTQVNFALSRGLAIRGVVTDPAGAPVRGARVMATSLLPRQPQNEETRTGADGHFEFLSLVEAPFQLSAMARGFQRRDEQPVQAGAEDVQLILDRQGAARIKVFGRNRLLTSYTLDVKSHFAAQDMIGNVQNQAPRNIRAGDLKDGFATVEGLNPGSYVFVVYHPEYAKTFSQPFTVGAGMGRPDVEVRMSAGGSIVGTVTDPAGNPVGGALVQTQPNGYVRYRFFDALSGLVPKKITETAVRTDGQGRYRLSALAEGVYQLEFTHPEFSDVHLGDLQVTEGQNTQVPPLSILPGTVLGGTTTLDGVPAGQIKVSIQMAPDPTGANLGAFNAEAVSNNEGEYVLTKRVPPGVYQIQASRQASGPFEMMIDYEKTRRTITVGRGQEQLRVNIELPSR